MSGRYRLIDLVVTFFDRFAIAAPRQRLLLVSTLLLIAAIKATGFNPLKDRYISPFDILMAFPAWRSVTDAPVPVHRGHSDTIDSQLPNWYYYKSVLKNGDLPLWNLSSSGGVPGVTNLTSEFYSPFYWPFLLIDNPALGLNIGLLFKLLVGGLGTFLFVNLFLKWQASLFAAIVFMLSAFNGSWLFVSASSAAVWIPWLLWSVALYLIENNKYGLIGISLTSALMTLAGFPSVAAYGFYAFGLLVLIFNLCIFETLKSFLLRMFLPMLFVAFGMLLCAVPIAALLTQLSEIELGYRQNANTILDKESFLFFWDPLANKFHVESNLYLGKLPVIFFGLFLCWIPLSLIVPKQYFFSFRNQMKRKKFAFVIFSVTMGLLAISIAFNFFDAELVRKIPVFSFNPWQRLIVLINLALALSGAIIIDILLSSPGRIRALFFLGFLGATYCQVIDQTAYFRKLNALTTSKWFFPETPSIKFVKDRIKPLENVIADQSYFVGGVISAYGFSEWFSHEFKPDPVKKLLEKVVKNPWASPTAAGFSGDFIQIDKPYLKLIGTKYLLVDRNVEEVLIRKAGDRIDEWNIHRLEDGISVFERKEAIKGAFFVPKLSSSPDQAIYTVDFDVKIVSTQEVKVTTQASTNGLVVLPLYVNADWHAYKNGLSVPIHKYQKVLAAVEVDGPATITFQYQPKFLTPGILLTLLGIIVLTVSTLLCKFGRFRFGVGHSLRGET